MLVYNVMFSFKLISPSSLYLTSDKILGHGQNIESLVKRQHRRALDEPIKKVKISVWSFISVFSGASISVGVLAFEFPQKLIAHVIFKHCRSYNTFHRLSQRPENQMIRFSRSNGSTALNHFIFNVSQTFLCCDKMLTGPWCKKFAFTFLISAYHERELEWHSATYNMVAGGNRLSHNWKWPKQNAAPHNPSLITCILTPASSPRIFLTSNSGATI